MARDAVATRRDFGFTQATSQKREVAHLALLRHTADTTTIRKGELVKSVEEVLAKRQAQLRAAYGSSEKATRNELLLTIQTAKRQIALLDKKKGKAVTKGKK